MGNFLARQNVAQAAGNGEQIGAGEDNNPIVIPTQAEALMQVAARFDEFVQDINAIPTGGLEPGHRQRFNDIKLRYARSMRTALMIPRRFKPMARRLGNIWRSTTLTVQEKKNRTRLAIGEDNTDGTPANIAACAEAIEALHEEFAGFLVELTVLHQEMESRYSGTAWFTPRRKRYLGIGFALLGLTLAISGGMVIYGVAVGASAACTTNLCVALKVGEGALAASLMAGGGLVTAGGVRIYSRAALHEPGSTVVSETRGMIGSVQILRATLTRLEDATVDLEIIENEMTASVQAFDRELNELDAQTNAIFNGSVRNGDVCENTARVTARVLERHVAAAVITGASTAIAGAARARSRLRVRNS